jgi:ketosteroid isomerase-like protein
MRTEDRAMHDPIAPSAAAHPGEAVELVCQAVSDGDLEAALAQYEHGAVLRLWAIEPAAEGSGLPTMAESTERLLSQLMELRLPVRARVRDVVRAGDIALVVAERQIAGVGAQGRAVALKGAGAAVVVRQPGGRWQIAADAWRLAATDGQASARPG